MAVPRVFISSTCYDLRYIRENLKFFVKSMGFEPVLSEEGSVYYNPELHIQDACLAEVPNCQIFVLIIGGHFGSKYKDKPDSIVNYEYRTAIEKKIPVFAMVEEQVQAEFRVYQKNKTNKELDASKISYPGVDSTRIFDFMEEVQSEAINNSLVPFSDFDELQSYLKQQWAGMMFSFLTRKSESERVTDTLETIRTMSNRIEFLSKQILSSVGKDLEKINAELNEAIYTESQIVSQILGFFEINPTPIGIVRAIDIEAFFMSIGLQTTIENESVKLGLKLEKDNSEEEFSTSMATYDKLKSDYQSLRETLLNILDKNGMSPEGFIRAIEERKRKR